METCKYKNSESNQNGFEDFEDLKLYKYLGNALPTVDSFKSLIGELNEVFKDDSVNIELVYYLLKSYKSNPSEWKKYAKFDRYRYTRNLVDDGNGKYNLMALCWGEGHGSAIHDHANSHCFMKMLQGSLEEIRFAWPKNDGEELQETGRTCMNTNDVCYINDSLGLHRVENPSYVECSVSLHLYCPPYQKCSVFNQNTGQRSTTTVTFWSMFGEKRNHEIQERRSPEDN